MIKKITILFLFLFALSHGTFAQEAKVIKITEKVIAVNLPVISNITITYYRQINCDATTRTPSVISAWMRNLPGRELMLPPGWDGNRIRSMARGNFL